MARADITRIALHKGSTMFGTTRLRRMAAVPILIGLALSGGLLTASPASAAEDTLQLLTPAADERVESRTVTVSGLGTPGGLIQVDSRATPIEVADDGTWQTLVAYSEDSFAPQRVAVSQTVGGEAAGAVERWFRIPDPIVLFVDTPVEGAAVDTHNPRFRGRAPEGTVITATVDGEQAGSAVADAGGVFSMGVFLAPSEAGPVDVLIEGTHYDAPVQPSTRRIVLPTSLPAPQVTSPVDTTVTGPTVTITGTSVPQRAVYIEVRTEGAADDEYFASLATPDAAGSWSADLALPAGNYSGVAFVTQPFEEGFGTDFFLPDSYVTQVAFSVEAPASVVPAAAAPAPAPVRVLHESVPAPVLAATGSGAETLAGGAGALLALGALLTLAVRRRATSMRP